MSRLSIAGQQLMKGNFGNAITALATKSASELTVQASRWRGGNFFFGVFGNDKTFVWGNYNSSLIAYQRCPVVSSIIHKKALCHTNGNFYVMDESGKESTNAIAKSIKAKMQRPNHLQTRRQFRAQNKVYKQIYGYAPILRLKPVGYEKDRSKWVFWNIPPWMITVDDNPDFFFGANDEPFREIRLSYMGRSVVMPKGSIVFIKENQISTGTFNSAAGTENVSMFLPDSRLKNVEGPVDNLIASLASRGKLIKKRGPLWILTGDQGSDPEGGIWPNEPNDIDNLKKDFGKYGMMPEQSNAIITDAQLKLQTVGFDVGQLKLLEGEIQDAKMIADELDFPPYLMGLVDAKYDNQDIAERSLYSNSIIPDAECEDEQWNEIFELEGTGLSCLTDFSHLPALQENLEQKGRGLLSMNQAILIAFVNGIIHMNRWRELIGEDTVAGQDLFYKDAVEQSLVIPAAVAAMLAMNANGLQQQQQNNSGNSNSNSNG